jgi:hypothetical protein
LPGFHWLRQWRAETVDVLPTCAELCQSVRKALREFTHRVLLIAPFMRAAMYGEGRRNAVEALADLIDGCHVLCFRSLQKVFWHHSGLHRCPGVKE